MSRPMKESGIEWIGDIPAEWEVRKAKTVFFERRERLRYDDVQLTASQKYGMIPQNLFIELENQKPVLVDKNYDNFKHVEAGDFVISLRSFQGGLEYSTYCGAVSPAYTVIGANEEFVNKHYFKWLFKNDAYIKAIAVTSDSLRDGKSLKWSNFILVDVPLPPLPQQAKIAAYLDKQVATIDAIIADTKESIQALKDYKQAIITETVTKGLDPQAPMKDSGIEWIGQVPEGWEVRKNKYIYDFSKGLSITKADLTETGIPVINYGQIHSKYPVFFTPGRDDLPFVPSTFSSDTKSKLNFGDFVFADTSEDYLGSGNFSMHNSEIEAMAGYHTIVLKVNKLVEYFEPKYLAYYFAGDVHRNQIRRKISGVKVFTISQTILKNTYCLIPPLDTQTQIVAYLDQKIGQIDQLVADKEALIAEYEAYKKSLIYEVVTGKRRVD
ncbi:TPA: restriction endonuclease subunit S [Streptococcus suis]